MAAATTAPPPTIPTQRRRRPPPPARPVQPPRVIWPAGPAGPPEDVTGLDDDAFFEAITGRDHEPWDYARIAAECGRTPNRIRKWVMRANAAAEARKAAAEGRKPSAKTLRRLAGDDKTTFVLPDGFVSNSPWWYASTARRALYDMEIIDRRGVVQPYRPAGRKAGAVDLKQRTRVAPARAEGPAVLAAYRELTAGPTGLSDREARQSLSESLGLTRVQVADRLKSALAAEAGGGRGPVDNAALAARYRELFAEYKQAGYSDRGSSERARAALSDETGISRRALAARIQAAETVAGSR
jgi:hypothetical protein